MVLSDEQKESIEKSLSLVSDFLYEHEKQIIGIAKKDGAKLIDVNSDLFKDGQFISESLAPLFISLISNQATLAMIARSAIVYAIISLMEKKMKLSHDNIDAMFKSEIMPILEDKSHLKGLLDILKQFSNEYYGRIRALEASVHSKIDKQ